MLVSCCIVDILRIYAPEAPYEDAQLKVYCFEFQRSSLQW